MLAHVLSGMLATLPGVEALPYMQADHYGVGFEAHIPLTFLPNSRSFVEYGYRCRDAFVYCFMITDNDLESYVQNVSLARALGRSGVWCMMVWMGCKEKLKG